MGKSKPIFVWVIVAYLGLVVVGGVFGNVASLTGMLDIPERSLIDWVLSLSGVILAGALGIYLFKLKKIAVYIGLIWLVLGGIGITRTATQTDIAIILFNISVLVCVTAYLLYLFITKKLT